VTIRVRVASTGVAESVEVIADPGHGFGREAWRCAMTKRWSPAFDRAGNPTEGTVTIRVRFDR
jgi:protein TonB